MNKEPWNIDLVSRFQKLAASNKRNVVYIYWKADTSTFRYRVYNMCQALEASNEWNATYFFLDELAELENFFNKIDLLVLVRIIWTEKMEYFLKKTISRGITVLYDIDDYVFNIEKIPLVSNYLSGIKGFKTIVNGMLKYITRAWLIAKSCDGYIGTNAFLAERLKSCFGKEAFIINNFFNHEQLEISTVCYNEKRKGRLNPFLMGYYSGSPSHLNDFKRIVAELVEFLGNYPETTLEVVGFLDIPEKLKPFIKQKQLLFTPLVDFLTLQEKIAEADVNLVPLVDNEFTNCKSELKFFEASLVGTLTIATPIYAYKNSIEHEKSGYLCKDGEWYSVLEKVYKREIPQQVVESARKYCLNRYSPETQRPLIEKVLNKAYSLL